MLSVTLNRVVHRGPAGVAGVPLVIAHGLFGSARNWGAIAKRLSAMRDVIAVDMRNHGDSPRARPHGYPGMAADLAAVISDLGGQADVLGHSMGGKAAMALALAHPAMVRNLIVADIAPVAYAHSHSGHIEAMRSLDLHGITRRSQADARLSTQLPDPQLRAFFLQSLDLSDGAEWKLDLDALEDGMADTVGWPEIAGQFPGPALFVSGGASDYLTESHRPGVRAQFPDATFQVVPGAGHWLHAEKPREFVDLISGFLPE